ncbi:DUF1249 domain-containing protein [Methylococcus sp. EFPC2]|uniref:DUF1249 domain-containing protein n=1 Tax=Methylococcus sp. EFPC2 TaxID=2812648 RepID=UPI001967412A|nr:DUF1249 domain-containing protein [Methylococcus sp. EFPC2]QSA95643.1 DUF1249 domain-containing protein [Methylococcus sp. EFPC2]
MSTLEPINKSYWLSRVCEANYTRLLTLIPHLLTLPVGVSARADGTPGLELELLERSPYTLLIELTHSFTWEFGALSEPAVRIRVYLDAHTTEVLSAKERPYVFDIMRHDAEAREVMDYKWSLNYFLALWLDHCIASDYQFRRPELMQDACYANA